MKSKNKYTWLLIPAALMIFSLKSKAAPGSLRSFKNFSPDKYPVMNTIWGALLSANFKDPLLTLAMAQVLHETGILSPKFNLATSVFYKNNNPTGIIWINNPALQKNAVKGSPFPKSEGKYFYAKFNSLADWAVDYKRILMKGKKPALASDPADFTARLAANRYFYPNTGAALETYKKAINKYFGLLYI